jgi:hypothetical protein
LLNEELVVLFRYNDQVKEDESEHGKDDEFIQGFGGKESRKTPLGISSRRREDSVTIDFIEIESGGRSRYSGELWAGRPGFDSWHCKNFLSSTASTPTVGPAQPAIQWIPGALSPGVKRQGREADHSPPSSAEVKKDGAIPPPPYVFMA